jgi:hypothetical protein
MISYWPIVVIVASFVAYSATPFLKKMMGGNGEDDMEYDGAESTKIRHEGNI